MELRFEEGPFDGKRKRSGTADGNFPKQFVRVGTEEHLYYLRRRIITKIQGSPVVVGLVYGHVTETEVGEQKWQETQKT